MHWQQTSKNFPETYSRQTIKPLPYLLIHSPILFFNFGNSTKNIAAINKTISNSTITTTESELKVYPKDNRAKKTDTVDTNRTPLAAL